jgi:hypothetical protein
MFAMVDYDIIPILYHIKTLSQKKDTSTISDIGEEEWLQYYKNLKVSKVIMN